MKKVILTFAIVLTVGVSAFAQRSLLGKSDAEVMREDPAGTTPSLIQPEQHNMLGNQNANAPLGTGVAIMLGLGAAYMVAKKRKED